MLCLFPKSLVMCGEQLLHSPYLQAMCALTVGLGLDQVLCHHPTPPHHTGNMPSTGLHLYTVKSFLFHEFKIPTIILKIC